MKWEVMSWAETAGAEQRILSPSTTASLHAAPPKLVHVQPTRDRPSTAAARLPCWIRHRSTRSLLPHAPELRRTSLPRPRELELTPAASSLS